MSLNIKTKLLGLLTIVLFFAIGGMLFVLLFQEENLKHKNAFSHVEEISFSVIQSMIHTMDQGADDVTPIVEKMKKIPNVIDLRVFPTGLISEEKAAKMDAVEKESVKIKKKVQNEETFNDVAVQRIVEPVFASESCTSCHAAEVGEPLATVSIRYSFADTYNSIYSQRINAAIMLAITIIIALIILYITLNKLIFKDLKETTELIDELANGNLTKEISNTRTDEIGKFNNAIIKVRTAFNSLVEDSNMLTKAATNGELSFRADPSKHSGEFSKIIIGMNNTIDEIVNPLRVAAEYIDRISKFDIPPIISDNYKGEFNKIKFNLNIFIEAITLLDKDMKLIIQSVNEGRIAFRTNPEKHIGLFHNIISGINQALDRLTGLIDGLPIPVQIIDKNFNILYLNNKSIEIKNVNLGKGTSNE